jgi:hypothetical protein
MPSKRARSSSSSSNNGMPSEKPCVPRTTLCTLPLEVLSRIWLPHAMWCVQMVEVCSFLYKTIFLPSSMHRALLCPALHRMQKADTIVIHGDGAIEDTSVFHEDGAIKHTSLLSYIVYSTAFRKKKLEVHVTGSWPNINDLPFAEFVTGTPVYITLHADAINSIQPTETVSKDAKKCRDVVSFDLDIRIFQEIAEYRGRMKIHKQRKVDTKLRYVQELKHALESLRSCVTGRSRRKRKMR